MEYQASSRGVAGAIKYYMIPFPNFFSCQLSSIAFGVFFPPSPPPPVEGLERGAYKQELLFFFFFCRGFFLFGAIIMFVHTKKKDDEFFVCVHHPYFAGLAFTSRGASIHIRDFNFILTHKKK